MRSTKSRIYDHVLTPQEILILATPDSLAAICALPPTKRTAAQSARLRSFYLETQAPPALRDVLGRLRKVDEQIELFSRSFPTMMVMEEMTAAAGNPCADPRSVRPPG